MSSDGLSLVGFLSRQDHALNFLRGSCVPDDPSDQALGQVWQSATANLGPSFSNAGKPDILSIPAHMQSKIASVMSLPQVANWLTNNPGTTFRLIEIDPLLAFQLSINKDRSGHHCGSLAKPPAESGLYDLALPTNHDTDGIQIDSRAQSVILRSKNLNLGVVKTGLSPGFMGMHFDFSLSLVHVVRLNGRCYLHNGFHRAFGARMAGAIHIPCLFRDVPDPESAGIKSDGSTLDLAVLESPAPPTLGHYTRGNALPVKLRAVSRVLHVSWAEYILPDE